MGLGGSGRRERCCFNGSRLSLSHFSLLSRFGLLGGWAARIPFVANRFWARMRRSSPGQMYSFVTRKADVRIG